jgi:hypothetical protein
LDLTVEQPFTPTIFLHFSTSSPICIHSSTGSPMRWDGSHSPAMLVGPEQLIGTLTSDQPDPSSSLFFSACPTSVNPIFSWVTTMVSPTPNAPLSHNLMVSCNSYLSPSSFSTSFSCICITPSCIQSEYHPIMQQKMSISVQTIQTFWPHFPQFYPCHRSRFILVFTLFLLLLWFICSGSTLIPSHVPSCARSGYHTIMQ